MGRTLHYQMKQNKNIQVTDEDWAKIETITHHFKEHFRWTCEEPGFDSLDYFPRWPDWFLDSQLPKGESPEKHWDIVNKSYEELKARGMSRLSIIRELLSLKLIAMNGDNPNRIDPQEAYGFTKVAGNELNAALVTIWLTTVSHILPQHEFTLHDEGKFLTRRIVIKNGKARTQYGKVWKPVQDFCRPVNPADFKDHPEFTSMVINMDQSGQITSNGGGRQIMAGFSGEYFKRKALEPNAEKLLTTNLTGKV